MREEVYRFESADQMIWGIEKHVLAGTLNWTGKPDSPIVVMCHGLTRNRDGPKYVHLQQALEAADIASLRMDFFGHGDSDGERSDALLAASEGYFNAIGQSNIAAALQFLLELGYTRTDQIGLFGSSTGAEIILATAAEINLGALVVRAPCLLGNFEVVRSILRVKSPTRLVVGSEDELLPPGAAYEIIKGIPSRRLFDSRRDVYVIKGADHACAEPEHQEELARCATEWFARYLQP